MRTTNETRKPTAIPNGKTPRRDAKKNNTAKGGAVWRSVATKRGTALRSPDGRLYYGTAAEVRDAALMPWRRDALAQSLKLHRYCRDCGTFDAADFAECCAMSRREAIQYGTFDAIHGESVSVPADIYIKLVAGSRLVRDTFDEFMDEIFNSEIESLLNVAQSDTGKREIPLTRHERAALEKCAASPNA